jgi:hypothetical protein
MCNAYCKKFEEIVSVLDDLKGVDGCKRAVITGETEWRKQFKVAQRGQEVPANSFALVMKQHKILRVGLKTIIYKIYLFRTQSDYDNARQILSHIF